jgi:hypothetical protein
VRTQFANPGTGLPRQVRDMAFALLDHLLQSALQLHDRACRADHAIDRAMRPSSAQTLLPSARELQHGTQVVGSAATLRIRDAAVQDAHCSVNAVYVWRGQVVQVTPVAHA